MMDQGWDPRGEAATALARAIKSFGPQILGRADRLTGLLEDDVPHLPREVTLLTAAARAGAAKLITERVQQGLPADLVVTMTATEIASRTAMDPSGSQWAVGEFARALGHPVAQPAPQPPPALPPTAPSAPQPPPVLPTTLPPTPVLPRTVPRVIRLRLPGSNVRDYVAAGTYLALGLADMLLFTRHKGDAAFALSLPGSGIQLHTVHVPATPAALALGVVCVVAAVVRVFVDAPRWGKRLAIAVVLLSSLFAMLCWAAAGSTSSMNLVDLTSGTVVAAIPIVLGALSGIMCERSGVINIAIEGQLLTGAFAAAMVSSAVGMTAAGLWFGTLAGSLTGGLVGALLAVMAIRYLTDQIIIGVVINVLALGFTNYLYDRVMVTYPNFNTGNFFTPYKIPLLGDIPIIGPTFFDSTVFLYITYILLIVIQVALFHTRYGLRVRAVGEHPTAADTVGIKVLWTRYRNVILGGMVAGIGGAWLTVGSTGQFNAGMSNGIGYIGLAAMIFGRWRPFGAVAAALLFGFCGQLAVELQVLAVPIPPQILAMAPYAATIVAVAGLIGKVRAPAADGKPYVKA